MKRLKTILLFLVICISCFGQKSANDTTKVKEPSKFDGWVISDAFQAEAGYNGSFWKPTFNIAINKGDYYCIVNLYDQSGYYSIDDQALPHLYLKTDKGEVVDLELDGDEPILKFKLNGYYVARVWMPDRYVTRFIYYIPDINKFLSNFYVKYRVWIGNGRWKDVELRNNYVYKFNKRLKSSAEETTSKYELKQRLYNNPLDGF